MALEIPELGYVMNEANKEDPKDIDEFSIFGGGGGWGFTNISPIFNVFKEFSTKL